MAFIPQSNITIGEYKRVKPISVRVTKSMFEYVDKAVIKLPISARIKSGGEIITQSIDTAKLIEEGMAVNIDLGYNGSLKNEFVGFVSRVNVTSPCEVICEGYSYQLRQKTYTGTLLKVELKTLLQKLIEGTDITLSDKIPGFVIDKIILNGKDGCQLLEEIKKTTGNLIQIFFTGKQLYAGLQYLVPKADVKYKLRWNVIKDGALKQRVADNTKVTVNWIGEKKDGTKVSVKAGTGGVVKTSKSHTVTDESTLQSMADADHKKRSYDGYEGKITAFLTPYCEPGYRAVLTDDVYTERSGNYIINSVEVSYSTSGARRSVGIGFKL